jgi:hypothetical protein
MKFGSLIRENLIARLLTHLTGVGNISSAMQTTFSGHDIAIGFPGIGIIQPAINLFFTPFGCLRRPCTSLPIVLGCGTLFTIGRHIPLHEKPQRAKHQFAARSQFRLANDPIAVHKSAIFTIEVTDPNIALIKNQRAVVPTDNVALKPQLTIPITANEELGPGDQNFLSMMRAADNLQL